MVEHYRPTWEKASSYLYSVFGTYEASERRAVTRARGRCPDYLHYSQAFWWLREEYLPLHHRPSSDYYNLNSWIWIIYRFFFLCRFIIPVLPWKPRLHFFLVKYTLFCSHFPFGLSERRLFSGDYYCSNNHVGCTFRRVCGLQQGRVLVWNRRRSFSVLGIAEKELESYSLKYSVSFWLTIYLVNVKNAYIRLINCQVCSGLTALACAPFTRFLSW